MTALGAADVIQVRREGLLGGDFEALTKISPRVGSGTLLTYFLSVVDALEFFALSLTLQFRMPQRPVAPENGTEYSAMNNVNSALTQTLSSLPRGAH